MFIMDNSYSGKYQNKNPIHRLMLGNFINSLRRLLRPLTANIVLDIGCGEGYILKGISSCIPGVCLFGLDINDKFIRLCSSLNPTIPLLKADIIRLPFKQRSVGLSICLEVLEHLKQPEQALSEISRITSRYIILSVPNQPYFRISNFLRGRYLNTLGNQNGHIQLWSTKEFIDLIKRYFKIIKVVKPLPWVMVLCEKQ